MLLWSRFNPIEKMLLIWKEHRAFALLLFVDCIAFLYMAARSGFAGLAFMIETHMNAVICAIVLSYTPASSCRKAVHIFIIVALMNAMLGTAESFWKFRLFDYDQGWYVLKETYFRASAFMGHPLDNAIFTSVALFIAIVAGYRKTITAFIVPILLLSLMAFGGRTALLFSLIGLIMLAASGLWQLGITKQMGMRHLLAFAALCLLTPLCIAGAAYLAMHNVIGERLAAHAFWDVSAGSRLLAFSVFHYMTEEEIIFGASPERVMDIIYRMNQVVPLNNIENPWIMMFMQLGLVMFPFWLFAMFAFLFRLMKDKPLALKFAVLAYIVIASASNSFGRKDANFAIMVSAVICSEKMTCSVKKNSQRTENYMLCE